MNLQGKSLLIFGSRSLADSRVDAAIGNFLTGSSYQFIITALDPEGVCERVRRYVKASRQGLVLIQTSLDQTRAQGMHDARSRRALEMADHMLAIWDGHSKGTRGEIILARRMRVPTSIIKLQTPGAAESPDANDEFDFDLSDNAELFEAIA